MPCPCSHSWHTHAPGFALRFIWLLSPGLVRYLRKICQLVSSRFRGGKRKTKLRCLDISDSSGEHGDPQWPWSSFAFEVCFRQLNLNDHIIYKTGSCTYSFPSLSQSWVHVSRICAASVHAAKDPKLKHRLQEYQWQLNELTFVQPYN